MDNKMNISATADETIFMDMDIVGRIMEETTDPTSCMAFYVLYNYCRKWNLMAVNDDSFMAELASCKKSKMAKARKELERIGAIGGNV